MKKLLLVLFSILVIGLGGCVAPANTDTVTIEDLNENLECLVGLNGQLSCYEIDDDNDFTVKASGDLDKTKLPSYMLECVELYCEYVSVDDLGIKLKEKYFLSTESHIYDDYHKSQGETLFKFVLEGEYNENDIFAKISILLFELQYYDYYFLSSTHVVIQVYWTEDNGQAHRIIVESSSDNLLSEAITITPMAVYDGDLELYYDLMNLVIDMDEVYAYYNVYVTEETFIGYVLDYK